MVDMRYVNEQLVAHNVEYRVSFLCHFMGLGPEDFLALHQASPLIIPRIPDIVHAVYERLLAYECTRRHFMQRQHGTENLTQDESQIPGLEDDVIKFRQKHLAEYLAKILTSPYDEKLLLYLDWVGKIHTAHAGNPQIVIPLVEVNALFGYLSDLIVDLVCSLPLELEHRTRLTKALLKILWIQSDLFNRHYTNDGH
jgi:hypothetical protein